MKFKEYLKEKISDNIDDFITWISSLNIPKRKPRNIDKPEHQIMIRLFDLVTEYNEALPYKKDYYIQLITQNKGYLRKSKEELETVYGGNSSQKNKIKGKYATYIKFDTSSYDNFIERISDIEDFLKTLKHPHKKVLKNIVIKFVSSNEINSKAKYDSGNDILLINASKLGNTKEEYGSLRYVVLHELGHRYLKYNPQSWSINDSKWSTTKYSKKDSWTKEERFSELFAISHWEKKYNDYKDKIKEFKEIIE